MIRQIGAGAATALACLTVASAPTASAQPPAPDCGPDQAAVLQKYLDQKLTEPQTEQPWNPIPIAGNYDPCADLSTILLGIEKGTGSSPVQALMFHRGAYLGPATWKAYVFTSLNAERSTDGMVVLDYKTPGECNACPPAVVTSVRYQWRGDHVEVLDPLPPV
jgi:LppP/LprE lipoprotein